MSTKEVVKPLQECAKERKTIELYFQQGARRGLNDDCAANLLRWRVSEVDVPIDFVVAYQMAIRGFAIPAVLDIDLMGQKFHDPDWRGYEIVRSIRWQALEVAPANFHIVRESPGTASRVCLRFVPSDTPNQTPIL